MTRSTTPNLLSLLESGQLPVDTPLSRAGILAGLRAAGVEAAASEKLFAQIRRLARTGESLGEHAVLPRGEGRGRRYVFTARPAREGSRGASPRSSTEVLVVKADNLAALPHLPDASVDLVYIDPPFNTGKAQRHQAMRTVRDDAGDRVGFQGRRYRTERGEELAYEDSFADYRAFIAPRLREAKRVLRPNGALFVHLDWRESHYVKVLLDQIFGRDHFMNELIWAYDYGGRSKRKWSAKHDVIFWYAMNPKDYTFHFEAMDRIPYMAPGLVSAEKAARGKTPTDVWWHTIVPTNGKERTGYPTQKPLGVLRRILRVHTSPGDRVLDFFAGSGTTGEAAASEGRHCTLIDVSEDAYAVMQARLARFSPVCLDSDADLAAFLAAGDATDPEA